MKSSRQGSGDGIDTYLRTVNNPRYIEANTLVHRAVALLVSMEMTLEEARGWVRAWASGAGDGVN